MRIRINATNVYPAVVEVEISDLIQLWTDVEHYFNNNSVSISQTDSINISIDAKSVKEKLDNLRPDKYHEYFSSFFEENNERCSEGFLRANPLSSFIDIDIDELAFDSPNERRHFLTRLVETIFLAMNLSRRAGCQLSDVSLIEHDGRGDKPGPFLDCHSIENAWHRSITEGWPSVRNIEFIKVWKWLESQEALIFNIANTSAQKAISTLLSVSSSGDVDANNIIQASQVLESFLLENGESKARGLKRKIPAILGAMPSGYKNWITDFYKLRSQIVHGDFPILRPSLHRDLEGEGLEIYWNISGLFDKGLAVIVSIIQDLVVNNSNSYSFKELLQVDRTQG